MEARWLFHWLDSLPGSTFTLSKRLCGIGKWFSFLVDCYTSCRRWVESILPLLILSRLQRYLEPCTSTRMFSIPKLQSTLWTYYIDKTITFGKSFFRLSWIYICIFSRLSPFTYGSNFSLESTFEEHISCALPTATIFYLLRSIPSQEFLHISRTDTLESIVKWF